MYTLYDDDNFIIASIVVGEAKGSIANYAYILSNAKSEEKIGDTYYWEFEAIMDGQIQTLTAKSKYEDIIDELSVGNVQELRFDADNYVTKVVDVDAGDIYSNYTKQIKDESVYFMNDLAVANHELSLKGRTLYVTKDQSDKGLTLVSDAKAVVIQDENGKESVKTEFDSVSGAINYLADPDEDTKALEYKGDIVAILNDRGVAEWIVFVSDSELSTGSNKPNPGDNDGDVRYSYVDVATRNIYLDKRDQEGATQKAIETAAQKALASIGWQATEDMNTSKDPWTIKGVDMSSSNPAEVTFKITFEK